MGGLYNMVLGDGGEDDRGNILLAILGNPDPGRYRDSWVELADNGDPVIAIYLTAELLAQVADASVVLETAA